MALTVIGIFDDATQAQQALTALTAAGFSRTQIDLSAGRYADENPSHSAPATAFPDRHANSSGTRTEEFVDDTKDVGSGLGGFFSSLFGDDDRDDQARRYSTVGDRGSIVTVHALTEDEASRAAAILDEAGAVDVDERAAQYGYSGGADASATGGQAPTIEDTTNPGDQTIQVLEENLTVGKRTVETGGVRLRSRIIARPVEESIRLREERVIVQRTPVNRPATAADLNAFQEGEISLTEHAEVPVVSKTARVVEEISVGKDVSERDEVIHDTVRSTQVDVEPLDTTEPSVRPSGASGRDADTTASTR